MTAERDRWRALAETELRAARSNLLGVGLACFPTQEAQEAAFAEAEARLAAAQAALAEKGSGA